MSEQRKKKFDQNHSNFQTTWINPYSTSLQQMTPITTSGAFSPSIHSNVTGFSAAHLSSPSNYYSQSPRNYSLTLPSYSTNSPTSPTYSSNDPINIYRSKLSHYRLFNFLFFLILSLI
jgi:hypothetical protein